MSVDRRSNTARLDKDGLVSGADDGDSTPRTTSQVKEGLLSRREVEEAARDPSGRRLIIINDGVYDVTDWIDRHPGGSQCVKDLVGKDATSIFTVTHPKSAFKYLPMLKHSQLSDPYSSDTIESDFLKLREDFQTKGLFKIDRFYHAKKLALYLSLLGLVWAGVLFSKSLTVHLLSACLLGITWQQIAFIGHDAGHNGITHSREKDSLIGLFVGNFLTGISMGWWKRNHNVHHVVTNSIEHDPDIQHLPIFAISPVFLKEKLYSYYYHFMMDNDSLFTKILTRYQHYLYYVVMSVARLNLYAQGFLLIFQVALYKHAAEKKEHLRFRNAELATLLGFWAWVAVLFSYLPDWRTRFLFFFISHAIAGILHVQITLSHFSMPTYRGVTYDNNENGFVKTQLDGTLNINSTPYTDWFHGGLQYQIEHHLFPRMPRYHLRAASKYVREFCLKHGLPYRSVSFYEANRMTIATLKSTALESKKINPLFWDSFHASG